MAKQLFVVSGPNERLHVSFGPFVIEAVAAEGDELNHVIVQATPPPPEPPVQTAPQVPSLPPPPPDIQLSFVSGAPQEPILFGLSRVGRLDGNELQALLKDIPDYGSVIVTLSPDDNV